MKMRELGHLVINAKDVKTMISFYRDNLGIEVLCEEQFWEGKIGIVSLRVPPETIIDLRPGSLEDRIGPNVDHFCLVLEDTDMEMLRLVLKANGVGDDVRPAWEAQGYGRQFRFIDPEGNKAELRCYEGAS